MSIEPTPEQFAQLDNETALKLIYQGEEWADRNLREGKITQEVAWNSYFGLFHECEERRLWSERERLLAKIDTEQYNPFLSKNPTVIMMARTRLAARKANNN